MHVDRRGFIKGTAVVGAAVASMGLFACSQNQAASSAAGSSASSAGGSASSAGDQKLDGFEVSREVSSDIIVVGAGNSGLTAAVQAAELGASVVLIEVNPTHGINTEGMFGVDTRYQKEQNINVSTQEVIAKELVFYNYRVNALFWKDLVKNSAENIDWLEKHGVAFSGKVDNYYHLGHIPVFHWFVDGKGSNMTDPLLKAAKDLGAEVFFETRGRKLIVENGSVCGILAETVDGEYIRFNGKCVILATGGYIGDAERMAKLGIPETDIRRITIGRVGDGINMATEVGAEDVSAKSCFLREASFAGKGWIAPGPDFAIYSGIPIWVNENGERFVNELCGEEASGCITNAHYTQGDKFALWGQAAYLNLKDAARSNIDDYLADPELRMYKFDDAQSLCNECGFDINVFKQTIDEYNSFCDAGVDSDFGKNSDVLVRIDAPYYIGHFTAITMQSIGGIKTNRKGEVINTKGEVIPGLYAIGTDGCMLYGETYTISVPASCNGNNINSGRTAARSAVKYISS